MLIGEDARLWFVELLRSEQRFATPAALAAQLARDVAQARAVLRRQPLGQ
jgi:FAD synthase